MKNILVTGANGHVGSVTVKKLAESGLQVIAVTRKNKAIFDHPNIHHFQAELSDDDQVKYLFAQIYQKFTTIDAIIMTAGGFITGSFKNTSEQEMEQMISTNFKSAYFVVRHSLDNMLRQTEGGKYIFFSAKSALDATMAKNAFAYSLSKSMLLHLSEVINATGKNKKIVSTIIAPNIIDTPENRKFMPDANFEDWVTTDEIADMILQLCSETGKSLRNTVIKMYGNG